MMAMTAIQLCNSVPQRQLTRRQTHSPRNHKRSSLLLPAPPRALLLSLSLLSYRAESVNNPPYTKPSINSLNPLSSSTQLVALQSSSRPHSVLLHLLLLLLCSLLPFVCGSACRSSLTFGQCFIQYDGPRFFTSQRKQEGTSRKSGTRSTKRQDRSAACLKLRRKSSPHRFHLNSRVVHKQSTVLCLSETHIVSDVPELLPGRIDLCT